MIRKLKERTCKNRKCKKVFSPKTEWQKFCAGRCRAAVYYRHYAALVKKARLIDEIEQDQRGAAQ
jgi:hypothetical protein